MTAVSRVRQSRQRQQPTHRIPALVHEYVVGLLPHGHLVNVLYDDPHRVYDAPVPEARNVLVHDVDADIVQVFVLDVPLAWLDVRV